MSHCPRCQRSLPSSDEPLRFCSFCGYRLASLTPVADELGSTLGMPICSDGPVGEDPPPNSIGGYNLIRLLGAGGMGRVYEGESPLTGEKVAVKLLSAQFTGNPSSVERFRQEGRLASQISHPRCVFVFAADTENERPYIVMELMTGETLKDLVDRKGPFAPAEAIAAILDVIEGLQEAHRLGVIHRDVKPSNCFLMPDRRVKIGDFGLSKSLVSSLELTESGAFLGTVLYASPEQIKGEPVDFGSDIYSVCATLFHLLTGRPPHEHENPTAALARIISEDAPPIRSINPRVPRSLARIVDRGVSRDRTRRWENLEKLQAELQALIPGHLTYGGLGIRMAAYFCDELLMRLLLVLPLLAVLRLGLSIRSEIANLYTILVIFPLYFAVLEGTWGASLGKRLLGLRVCRTGTSEPPGLVKAAIRTLAFYLLIVLSLLPFRIAWYEVGSQDISIALLLIPFALGLLLLLVPMLKSNDFRGLHEMISGTCVRKLPPRARPLSLTSPHRPRLEELGQRPAGIPEYVGPYNVLRASSLGKEEWLLLAEDPVLRRLVVMHMTPGESEGSGEMRRQVIRPARLRALGMGQIMLGNQEYTWEAFVAPHGSPLPDVLSVNHCLSWTAVRPLLSQLAEELHEAEKDNTLPAHLSVDQVWVQLDGRIHLVDFPFPCPRPARSCEARDALGLLRDVAAHCLEGSPRRPDDISLVQAAIPFHAAKQLQRLMGGPEAYRDVAGFRFALEATRDQPTEVTPAHRFAHLALQALVLSLGLAYMFLASGLYGVVTVRERETSLRQARYLREHLDDPTTLEALSPILMRDQEVWNARLDSFIARQTGELERLRPALNGMERKLLHRLQQPDDQIFSEQRMTLTLDRAREEDPATTAGGIDLFYHWGTTCLTILAIPVCWAVFAGILRGGPSYRFTGLGLVRKDGRRVGRLRWAARVLLLWLPVALLLCGSVWVQANAPEMSIIQTSLWLSGLALLPLYLAFALAHPGGLPQDWYLGNRLVPR